MNTILALLVRKLAEGDFGEFPKKCYWWLSGKKTYTGLALTLLWSAIYYAQEHGICSAQVWNCAGWSTTLASVAAFLVMIGLWDGALRSTPPNK